MAVLDTGVDPQHEDLQVVLPDGRPRLVALSAIPGDEADVADSLGHGTMVCGVMAACTNNHVGIAGMAGGMGSPESTPEIYSIKVTSGRGQAARGTDLARGIVMAVGLGARAINISFAGSGTSDALRSALAWATSQGCVVVCGAGNTADEKPQYPAAHAGVGQCVAVTAADRDGSLPAFDTRGDWIDGAAPGVDILSTWPEYQNAYGSDLRGYAVSSGTSFAAPFVTGLADLASSVDSSLAGGDFRELFRCTARGIGDAGTPPFTDAPALLQALLPPYQLAHGDAAAERWWDAGEETLHIRRSAFWRSAGAVDGDYIARRFEVRATTAASDPLEASVVWVRPTGAGGWRMDRMHDGEESWGETVAGEDRALRTYVYRIDSPPAGCDTCAPVGWMPRAPWEVVLPWTRWSRRVLAVPRPVAEPRVELVGASPARGAVAFRVSGLLDRAPATILIYDTRGRLIRHLPLAVGAHGEAAVEWTGNNEAGRIAPAGLYVARLSGSLGAKPLRFVRLGSPPSGAR